jgi:hypothetical protein
VARDALDLRGFVDGDPAFGTRTAGKHLKVVGAGEWTGGPLAFPMGQEAPMTAGNEYGSKARRLPPSNGVDSVDSGGEHA